jgi:penicillin V acylase-like amidase (Ntn superfamily)
MKRDLVVLTALILAGCNGVDERMASAAFAPPRPAASPEGPTIVAGSASDFMIVRHLRLAGTNEHIGKELAALAMRLHEVGPPSDDADLVARRIAWFRAHWPEHAERAQGVAEAFGRRAAENGFDPTVLLYNAAVVPGCSTVYYPGACVTTGHAMLSRNYDFSTDRYAELIGRQAPAGTRPFTADPYVIEVHPDRGHAALYVCAYNLLAAIDGINEKGLAVALLADDSSPRIEPPRTDGTGVAELTMVRYLLDRCATAKEAREVLAAVPYSWSFVPCHYIVGDASGDSFVWEIAPDLTRRFVVDGGGAPQVVTNHLLSRFPGELPQGNSFDRYRRLQARIREIGPKLTPEQVASTNACAAVPAGAQGAATLWHSVYDLAGRTLRVSFWLGRRDGTERRTEYLEFRLR